MKALDIMKESLRTTWTRKSLWFFGFFVAAASSQGGESDGTGASMPLETVPVWVFVLVIVGSLVALAGVAMHIISEAALIDGVKQSTTGSYSLGRGFRVGAQSFWRVLGLKAGQAIINALTMGIVSLPILGAVFKIIPATAAVAVALPLALVAVPSLLTVHFIYQYALRYVVLDGRGVLESIFCAKKSLHGRISDSLGLLGVSLLGFVFVFGALVVVLVPSVLVGGLVYLMAGQLPGLIAGMTLLVPLGVAVVGALGTYRSSVWTHGYLQMNKA